MEKKKEQHFWGKELILIYEGQFQGWPSQNNKRGQICHSAPFSLIG